MLKAVYQNCKRSWHLVLFLLISLLCLVSVLVPPSIFWPAVFTSYAIPVIIVINLLLLVILAMLKSGAMVYPLLALLASIPFLLISFNYSNPPDYRSSDLSILSLNAKFFRKLKTYGEFSFDMIKWAAEDSSDVKCFQEYSTNSRWPVLDVTKQIADKGYNSFIYAAQMDDMEHHPGMAFFTKFEIIDSGYVWKNYGTTNAGIFADILYHEDTIRIYNVHMSSMQLRLYQYKNPDRYVGKIRQLISKLKNGAEARSYQVDKLVTHTNACPYPYIICGDFNETPYSYNYFKLKETFNNAFEEVGKGFAFSLNSILFFLRIDHQFYSQEVEAIGFRVDRSMKISDHFPTRGYYRIK